MKKTFKIRIGGLSPKFQANNNFTCHPSEATVFNSIDEAKKANRYNGICGVSIVDAETLKFVSWVKW